MGRPIMGIWRACSPRKFLLQKLAEISLEGTFNPGNEVNNSTTKA